MVQELNASAGSGNILEVKNNQVNKFAVDYTGVITSTGDMTSAGANLILRTATTSTDNAGKTIRLNSITNTGTANSFIGFQSKPGQGTSSAQNVIGAEISPRLNDAIALTGSGSVIGLHADIYLKGTTGNVAGSLYVVENELVDDTGSSRTVSGNVTHLRVRSNISYAISGKYSVIRVENEEGTKAMDGLVQFTTGSGAIVEASGTVGGAQTKAIKILIDGTTFYVPLHASVS